MADRFRRSKVSAFHLISKLQEQGVVVRRANPSDRRSKLIYLTPKGRAVVKELMPLATANPDRAVEGIASVDLATTRAVLHRMAGNTSE